MSPNPHYQEGFRKGNAIMWVMSGEEGKIYGNTPTSILYPWYLGMKNTKFFFNNMQTHSN